MGSLRSTTSFSPIHLDITKYSSDHSLIDPYIPEVLKDLNVELQKERAAWKAAEQEKIHVETEQELSCS
ncbi:hypothetical protein AN958_06264 [Leucoagaricus sp. SymC.cos]|nr:hypothetical protein AN958_06264 [Leucoagaricus sp. SymC.cos]